MRGLCVVHVCRFRELSGFLFSALIVRDLVHYAHVGIREQNVAMATINGATQHAVRCSIASPQVVLEIAEVVLAPRALRVTEGHGAEISKEGSPTQRITLNKSKTVFSAPLPAELARQNSRASKTLRPHLTKESCPRQHLSGPPMSRALIRRTINPFV